MTDEDHREVIRLLRERGIEFRAEAYGGGGVPPELHVLVRIDGETVFEREDNCWIFGEPEEEAEMPKRDQSEIIGVHENTDWFRYVPNEPSRAEGCDVQAKWVNGSRVFRHRRKGGGAWRDGAPWDK